MATVTSRYKDKGLICFIDCRIDRSLSNDFLNLNLWGKPVYKYAIETAKEAGIFSAVIVVTDSQKIKNVVKNVEGILIQSEMVMPKSDLIVCILSGRAIMLKRDTLIRAYEGFKGGMLFSAVLAEQFDFSCPIYNNFLYGKKMNQSMYLHFMKCMRGVKTSVLLGILK